VRDAQARACLLGGRKTDGVNAAIMVAALAQNHHGILSAWRAFDRVCTFASSFKTKVERIREYHCCETWRAHL
jgi:hypothetical protein